MGLAEKVVERMATLEPEQQAEVLDFIEFLASRRRGVAGVPADWLGRDFEHLAVQQVVDCDDPAIYELSDCKELWPCPPPATLR